MKRFSLLFITVVLFSCKKDPRVSDLSSSLQEETNDVIVQFTHVSNGSVIQLSADQPYTSSTPTYTNANSDTFSVSKLKYYISNVRLKKADGTYYNEKNSYHLIDAADTINRGSFKIKGVPADNYLSIEFMLGVDSAKTMSGAQDGDLDPIHDMYWDWNQGYIFFKFEGYSSKAPAGVTHNLTFHVGGFRSPDINNINFVLPLPSVLPVHKDHPSTIYIKNEIQECFMNPDTIKFSTFNFAAMPSTTKNFANNYKDIFTVSAVKH